MPCVCVCSVLSDSLSPRGLQPTMLLCPWDSPGKNTRVGFHFLLQGIFQTRDQSCVSCDSCIGRYFTTEPPGKPRSYLINYLKKKNNVNRCREAFDKIKCAFITKSGKQEQKETFSTFIMSIYTNLEVILYLMVKD